MSFLLFSLCYHLLSPLNTLLNTLPSLSTFDLWPDRQLGSDGRSLVLLAEPLWHRARRGGLCFSWLHCSSPHSISPSHPRHHSCPLSSIMHGSCSINSTYSTSNSDTYENTNKETNWSSHIFSHCLSDFLSYHPSHLSPNQHSSSLHLLHLLLLHHVPSRYLQRHLDDLPHFHLDARWISNILLLLSLPLPLLLFLLLLRHPPAQQRSLQPPPWHHLLWHPRRGRTGFMEPQTYRLYKGRVLCWRVWWYPCSRKDLWRGWIGGQGRLREGHGVLLWSFVWLPLLDCCCCCSFVYSL